MTEVLLAEAVALLRVMVVGVVLGAGVPAIYALGMRALCWGRPVSADGTELLGPAPLWARIAAGACFGLAVLAVLFGIVVIVFGKKIFG